MIKRDSVAVLLTSLCLLGCQRPQTTFLPISTKDIAVQAASDTDFGSSRPHYRHVELDEDGDPMEAYEYYRDISGKPVLDGVRWIRRGKHGLERTFLYHNGHFIREWEIIVTG